MALPRILASLGLLVAATASRASVVRDVLATRGGAILRFGDGETRLARPEGPPNPHAMLSERVHELVSDGAVAWGIEDAPLRAGLQLLAIDGADVRIHDVRSVSRSLQGTWHRGVAGSTAEHVFLEAESRFEIATGRVVEGHLPQHPDLSVFAACRTSAGSVLLAGDDARPPRAWIVGPDGTRLELGARLTGDARLAAGPEGVVVATSSSLVVVDPLAPRVVASLPLPKDETSVLFLSAHERTAWAHVIDRQKRQLLLRADLDTGRIVDSGLLPARQQCQVLHDAGDALWLSCSRGLGAARLLSCDKTTGELALVDVGPPQRVTWQKVRRGAALGLLAVTFPASMPALVAASGSED